MKNALIALCLALLAVSPAFAQPVSMTDLSNWNDVIEAVDVANANGGGTIGLRNRAEILVDGPLPAITEMIVLEGNGATLKPADVIHESIIRIEEEARLEIKDLFITEFLRNFPDEDAERFGLIDNSGQTVLERVTLADNPYCEDCRMEFSLIFNRNYMRLNNVTIHRNNTKGVPPLENEGILRITNSTLSENGALFAYCSLGPCVLLGRGMSLSTTETSSTVFGNVILYDDSHMLHLPVACWLEGEIIDLGGNLFTDGICDSVVEVEPYKSANLGSFGYHGGLVPTVGLEPGSIAIDTGVDENCSATDARFANRPASGSIHSEPKCDAGAFEYGGGFGNSDLAVNGMNGMWFSLASDGHYLHIMRVSPDRVHITWTAFDQSANQMWIYAVANITESTSFSTTAYINLDGLIVPGSAPSGSHVEKWGNIEIEFDSCVAGTFRYDALDHGIGSGEFTIDRLAFMEGVGCTD